MSPWSRGRQRGNRFGLEVFLEAGEPHLPADAGLLVSPEGHVRRVPDPAVDVDGADPHPRGDTGGALLVRREDRPGQPVRGIVGDPHRVVITVVGDHREHRTEDLLARDLGVVVQSGDDGRLDEEPGVAVGGTSSPAGEPATLGDRRVEIALDAITLAR